MKKQLTTIEFANKVGLTDGRIRQMIRGGEITAEKFGRDYVISELFVGVILNRPERRGRPKKELKAA